jgi:PAS domain S-box-containing protein
MQYTIFVILAPVTALLVLAALFYAWQHRHVPGAPALIGYLTIAAGFTIGNTLELISPTQSGTLFWAKFDYIFISVLPIAWLVLALQYSGNSQWLSPRRFWVFFIFPILTFSFALTTEKHGLVWASYTFREAGNFLALRVQHGLWFYVNMVYAYMLLIAGAVLVGREHFLTHRIFRQQTNWMLLGVVIPLMFNAVYVFRLIPGLDKDFSPVAFALSGLAFVVGIFRYRLLNLRPIARDFVVEHMPEGMIILDYNQQIIDYNPAALWFLDKRAIDPIGKGIQEIWPEGYAWLGLPKEGTKYTEPETRPDTIYIDRGGRRLAFSLHVTPITSRAMGQRGWLVLINDVSRRAEAEQALAKTNQALTSANNALAQANAELMRLNQDLEERVTHRTTALTQRAIELEGISRVSSALRKATNLTELLDILLLETTEALGAKSGSVFLIENEELCLRAASLGAEVLDNGCYRHPPGIDPLWQAVETGNRIVIPPNKPADVLTAFPLKLQEPNASLVLAPLRSADRTVGLLALNFSNQPAEEAYDRPLTAITEMVGNALQRIRTMENLEEIVQARTRDISTLYEITSATNQFLALPDLLQRVLETVREVLCPRAALIHLQEEDIHEEAGSPNETLYRLITQAGLTPEQKQRLPGPNSPDAPWQNALPQPGNDPVPSEGKIVILPSLQGIDCACITLPIRAKGRALGTLTVLVDTLDHISAEDVALLAAIADHTGVAVENDRLHRMAERSAVMEERQRLARDLHDSVTQALYAQVLFAEACRDALKSGQVDKMGLYLSRLDDCARQALAEMRLLIYELRPLTFQHEGLTGALHRRLETVERRAGLIVELEADPALALPANVENGLFGIAQEALNNVIKHAHATRVKVRIMEGREPKPALHAHTIQHPETHPHSQPGNSTPDFLPALRELAEAGQILPGGQARHIHLEVTDDGRGFPSDQLQYMNTQSSNSHTSEICDPIPHQGGIGLESMRERARGIGGSLSIRSTEGQGTTVLVILQLPEETALD